MKNLFVSLCAAVAGMVFCSHAEESAGTIDTVVDYVALNGYSPKGFVTETRKTMGFTYNEETQTWEGRKTTDVNAFESDSTIVDFEGKEKVLKVLSVWNKTDAWQGPCVQYDFDSGVPLKHAQTVKIPYYYAGSGIVNKDLRIVVLAGGKSFSVGATEKISAKQWNVAEFRLSDVFGVLPQDYAACKDSSITRLRIYFGGFNSPRANDGDVTVTSFYFWPNEALYFAPVTYSYEEISSYTVSLDANGGEPIDDLQTDENFQVTLPTPVREGFEFIGWFYNGVVTAAGSTIDIVQNCTYVAGWRRPDPGVGLISLSATKQLFDLHAANGGCYKVIGDLDGYAMSYYPNENQSGKDRSVQSTGSFSVVVTPVESDGTTNFQVAVSSNGSLWRAPFIHPRLPTLRLSDIYEVRIPYSYTGNHKSVIGKALMFYYKIGNTWRHLEGDAVFAATDAGCKNTIRVKVGESLGSDYNKLKDETISDWKFYFYEGTIGDSGLSMQGWNISGTFVFYPMILAKQSGLILLLR